MQDLRRAIAAGVHVKTLRDISNRIRFGPDAPLSDELIWVRPQDVKHWYRSAPEIGAPRFHRRHSGTVLAGDWDLSTAPFEELKISSLREHFEHAVPWEDTQLFAWMLSQMKERGSVDGCRTYDDLVKRYRSLDRIYDEVKRTGYLRPHGSIHPTRREHGGTIIHIARDGAPLRYGGGAHRFAIAYILGIEKAPAQLGVIHSDAVKSGVLAEYRRPPQVQHGIGTT